MADGTGKTPSDPELVQDRIKTSKERVKRVRKRQSAGEQGLDLGAREPIKFHDILVIAPKNVHTREELFRVPVVKSQTNEDTAQGIVEGSYVDTPEKLDLFDYAQRRTLSFAQPSDWGARLKEPRGPAFGTLPVKREPAATGCLACYLVDAQNSTFENAWTAEDWNDLGAGNRPAALSADDPEFQVLVAGPRGKVFHLHVKLQDASGEELWEPGRRDEFADGGGSLQSLDLRFETEVWNQLRNGCVAGAAMTYAGSTSDTEGTPQVMPLVNITSLTPQSVDNYRKR